jgi:hypothetical protein
LSVVWCFSHHETELMVFRKKVAEVKCLFHPIMSVLHSNYIIKLRLDLIMWSGFLFARFYHPPCSFHTTLLGSKLLAIAQAQRPWPNFDSFIYFPQSNFLSTKTFKLRYFLNIYWIWVLKLECSAREIPFLRLWSLPDLIIKYDLSPHHRSYFHWPFYKHKVTKVLSD